MYKVIDLETTGLRNNDEIAQLAIWSLDDMLRPVGYSNYYYAITNEMPPSAYAVNKLSKSFLQEKSKGMSFAKSTDIVMEELSGHVLIAHNAVFERRMLGQHLNHALDNNEWICTMQRYTPTLSLRDFSGNGGYKQCNLRELVNFCLKVRDMELDDLYEIFKGVVGQAGMFHNALFDAYCTAYAFNTLG